jgi:nitrate/TMAO reductase-like tetraheme cytochrome c subunit/ribosomal protein S27E
MAEDKQQANPPITGGSTIPSLIKNPLSLIGLALAGVAFANILFLAALDLFSAHSSPYIGILAYMVAPAILVVGLIMAVIGMVMERRRRAALKGSSAKMLRIDLNNPAQRSSVAFALSFVVMFALISAAGSYKAYEFTDSIQFCGQLCHSVMSPEFTAYQASPHARVGCVDCHVGSGASWYVKSKISGARQVYYTMRGTYPRPIPSPVHNLRPAQDTCEQCHWPKKFWGAQLKTFTHFGSDEQNTPRVIRMLIKVGGGDPGLGQAGEGIHWHMNIANKISYYSTDEQRQTIPYVRMENSKGEVTEYTVKDNPPNADQIAKADKRRMDCIDCHNRPSHIYTPPDLSVDRGISGQVIDPSLPFIKQQGVQVLTADYKTHDEAAKAIADNIQKFYQDKYPQIATSKADSIKGAVAELQRIYRTTFFPEMKVNWKTHPNNIGHFYYQGCFRCHDGNHVSKDGKVISKDCNSCHTVMAQEEGGAHLSSIPNEAFKHPVDLGDMTAVNCADCHSGGVGP